METLFKLAKYSSEHLKVIEALLPPDLNNPLNKLFKIILSGKNLNNDQAMQIIYGKKNLASFFRLKLRVREILIKAFLIQDSSLERKNSRINEAMAYFRHTLVSKILINQNINNLAIEIAEKSIVKSIKFHSTENVLLLSRILIRHYGSTIFDKKKLNKYLNLEKKYLRIHSWELKAENYFIHLQQIQFASMAAPDLLAKEKAARYVEELDSVHDIKTYFFNINKYKVRAAYFEFLKDYDSLLKISDNAIKELNLSNISLRNINLRKAWALIQAGRNEDAIVICNRSMKTTYPGSLAWYFMAHYKLKAQLYKGDYKNAVDLIKLMIENPLFSKIGGNYRELFTATLGYIHLIVDSGLAGDPEKFKKLLPDFKIGKFLNAIPVFSKDKQGINVSILLMHVAILLQRKNHDAIIDRADSLKQYAYKYLRKDDSFRSNCMIKMVIQMTKAGFNPIRTERYTRDLLKQLEAVKLAGSGENIETEIIPYEVLWTIMKKAL